MKKQRKHYTPEEKVAILRRHLLEKEPISKLCDELGLQPTVFYRWHKEFFENGAAAFEQKRPTIPRIRRVPGVEPGMPPVGADRNRHRVDPLLSAAGPAPEDHVALLIIGSEGSVGHLGVKPVNASLPPGIEALVEVTLAVLIATRRSTSASRKEREQV